jgi:drug/metabolite transporter (DMT)-like permease
MLKENAAADDAAGTAPAPAAAALSQSVFRLSPGITAGAALGISDVLAKLVLATGCDVLTMLSFRSVVGLAFVASWLRFGRRPSADARVRWVSMGIGIMFAGLIYCLFKAIAAIDVPTAILSYFTYPLLTGFAASFAGLEPFRFKGVLCALAAFCGLAIMIGAHPAGLAFAGVAYALGAACCRTAVLLATRAYLTGADARLTTWYSMLSSTAVFLAASLATQTWHPPQTGFGWTWLVALSLATTAGILFVFVSTMRIGPFRTALIMHLEPLTAMVLSALVLGEAITPVQGLGSGIMLAALIAFQLWR